MTSTIKLSEILDLTEKQKLCLSYLRDKETTEVLYGGGAGGGKSFLGCSWITINCLKFPGTRWLIGRAKLKALEETTLNTFFEVAKLFRLIADVDYKYNAQKNRIVFANGSEIYLKDLFQYPSDKNFDSLGSLEITGAFIDECNQIVLKAWEIVKSRIRFKLDEYGLTPKILGSCNPAKNWVYSTFYVPNRDKKLPTALKFIKALVTDNKHISKHYIENLRTLKDKNAKERLLHGNWEYDDSPNALVNYNACVNAFTNTFVKKGKNFITGDIARFGRDKTVIGVWSGWRLIRIVTLDKNKITEAADLIKKLAHEHEVPLSDIIVDDDGVGGGVTDILGCNGFVNNSAPLVVESETEDGDKKEIKKENYANLKSQCSYKLAEKINSNGLYIECEDTDVKDKIIEELGEIKQKDMDKDGKKAIIPKDEVKENIGRSPDYSDMIMMRVWFDIRREFKFW